MYFIPCLLQFLENIIRPKILYLNHNFLWSFPQLVDIRFQNYEEVLYKLHDFLICSLTKNSLSLLSLTYCWFWSFFSSTRGYVRPLNKDSSSSKFPQPGFRLSTSVKAWYTQQKWLSQGDRARPGGRAQWMSRGPRSWGGEVEWERVVRPREHDAGDAR